MCVQPHTSNRCLLRGWVQRLISPRLWSAVGGMGLSQGKPHRTYLDDWYREARNAKTKSGRHAPFHESVGNKAWLIYWHERLEVTGNRDLGNCAYGELGDNVRCLSTDGHI